MQDLGLGYQLFWNLVQPERNTGGSGPIDGPGGQVGIDQDKGELLGVDGRSGNIGKFKIVNDGKFLDGMVTHGGYFRYDMTIPSNPIRVFYKIDHGLEPSSIKQ